MVRCLSVETMRGLVLGMITCCAGLLFGIVTVYTLAMWLVLPEHIIHAGLGAVLILAILAGLLVAGMTWREGGSE